MRRVLATLFATAIVIASCGSDDDTSTTEAQATEPPATEPAATEPPATEPPATDPPATDPPATDPPATDPPATEPPATEPPASDPAAGEAVEVSLVEWEVMAPADYAAGAITFNATNDGEFPHEFVVIAGDGYASLPQSSNGEVIEDELSPDALIGRTDRFEPGESMSLTVELEPGNYVLLCNIAVGPNSHAGAGQTLDVSVS